MDTFIPLPPPYTPNAGDPLPIIYQLSATQSVPDIHGNFGRALSNPTIAGVHLGQPLDTSDSDRRWSRTSQDHNQSREDRGRHRGRHRRRRSRGTTSQNPANEDQSALIFAAQDTAMNSSPEDDSNMTDDNTQQDMNTQQCPDNAVITATNVTNAINSEDKDICDNALTENVMLETDERGEFIELGDTLTIPSSVDPDRLTLQSETSGSFYSGADSASGCSTLEQGSSSNSLNKGKTHRRSVSGVSCISKTSVEPSVSKVDEEPCECKCTCKCDCKPGVSCGDKCTECEKTMHGENDCVAKNQCDNRTTNSIENSQEINENEQRSTDQDILRRNATINVSPFTLETNSNSASFV